MASHALPDLDFSIPSFTNIPDPEKQESDYNEWMDKLFDKAKHILEEADTKSSNWTHCKKLNGIDVNTCKNNALGGNTYWAARHSLHKDMTYDDFKRGLYDNHAKNEAEYMDIIKQANLIKSYKEGEVQVWSMEYKMPGLVKDRVFNVVILKRDLNKGDRNGSNRAFMDISIPVKISPDDVPETVAKRDEVLEILRTRVPGYYVAVEQVAETGNGEVKWDMATSSKAGGSIPDFVTNMTLASTITHDVASFLDWLTKQNAQ